MTIQYFTSILSKLESLSSRNEMTEVLANEFINIEKDSISPFFYFLQGRLAPKFVPLEYNFSEKMILRGIGEFSNEANLMLQHVGDLGDVVMQLKLANKLPQSNLISDQAPLEDGNNLFEMWLRLKSLAEVSGKGSQELKVQKFFKTISLLSPLSSKFVTRIILGDLRLGISEKTILDALGFFLIGGKQLKDEINYAFGINSDLSLLAKKIFELKQSTQSIDELKSNLMNLSPTVGLPIAPKLVERETSPESVWERMPNCIVQPKLDGLRGQIHFDGTEGYIFSRNQESLTSQFPEIISSLKELGVSSIILDSEIISYDDENERFGTYHETMQRRRKYDIELFADTTPVSAMCFDILYLNGVNLLNLSTYQRFEILRKLFLDIPKNSHLKLLQTIETQNLDQFSEFYFECIEKGLEGIIAKAKESTYEPGTRNFQWIKLKYNVIAEKVDTIDLLVMGYYAGGGQRAKFGFGALLCGVVGSDEKIYSTAKVGSGFSEELLKEVFPILQELQVKNADPSYVFNKAIKPDSWVRPKMIIEVDADEITRSPLYSAGLGISANLKKDDVTKGLSLRFPRIKRIRFDKTSPNSVDELVRIYELRKRTLS